MADIDLKVECDKCGTELEAEIRICNYQLFLIVRPCSCCMDAAKDNGYDEGHSVGFEDGKREGDGK
jgi:hypothetical protein